MFDQDAKSIYLSPGEAVDSIKLQRFTWATCEATKKEIYRLRRHRRKNMMMTVCLFCLLAIVFGLAFGHSFISQF